MATKFDLKSPLGDGPTRSFLVAQAPTRSFLVAQAPTGPTTVAQAPTGPTTVAQAPTKEPLGWRIPYNEASEYEQSFVSSVAAVLSCRQRQATNAP